MTITDSHTHHAARGAIVNVSPAAFSPVPGMCYSVGIHPWEAGEVTVEHWQQLATAARSPQVVALGETGLDALRGPSPDVQQEVLARHVAMSEELSKPLILHCVKAFHVILAMRARLRPAQPWVVHGFRGKPQLARQLLNAGLYITLGPRFNAATACSLPGSRLLLETDDSGLTIATVAARVAEARGEDVAATLAAARATAAAIFAPANAVGPPNV